MRSCCRIEIRRNRAKSCAGGCAVSVGVYRLVLSGRDDWLVVLPSLFIVISRDFYVAIYCIQEKSLGFTYQVSRTVLGSVLPCLWGRLLGLTIHVIFFYCCCVMAQPCVRCTGTLWAMERLPTRSGARGNAGGLRFRSRLGSGRGRRSSPAKRLRSDPDLALGRNATQRNRIASHRAAPTFSTGWCFS